MASTKRKADADAEEESEDGSDNPDEDADEEPEELSLSLDKNNRPEGPPGCDTSKLQYSFAVIDSALSGADDASLRALRSDAATLHSALEAEAEDEQSGGLTYFVRASSSLHECRCSLERLALEVFHLHTRNASGFDPRNSGAEFWTQVLDPSDEIGFHHDADGTLEDDAGVCVHPHIATVTSLSDGGMNPTVIVEGAAPVLADDVSTITVPKTDIAFPKAGKHISFDGRFAHGAPALAPDGRADGTRDEPKRVTFLVNVWISHLPAGAEELPQDVAESLTGAPNVHMRSPNSTLSGTMHHVYNVMSSSSASNKESGANVKIEKYFHVRRNKRLLELEVPAEALQYSSSSVEYAPGSSQAIASVP